MRQTATLSTTTISSANLPASIGMLPTPVATTASNAVNMGKEAIYGRNKDESLLCHMIGDGLSPNDINPPLISITARFPDRAKLRAQILDAEVNNPGIRMPLFGKHQAFLKNEISASGNYLNTL